VFRQIIKTRVTFFGVFGGDHHVSSGRSGQKATQKNSEKWSHPKNPKKGDPCFDYLPEHNVHLSAQTGHYVWAANQNSPRSGTSSLLSSRKAVCATNLHPTQFVTLQQPLFPLRDFLAAPEVQVWCVMWRGDSVQQLLNSSPMSAQAKNPKESQSVVWDGPDAHALQRLPDAGKISGMVCCQSGHNS